MIRVLIVDDHAIFRAGLKQILSDAADIIIVGEAGNGNDALRFLQSEHADVALLDMSMPGRSGVDLIKDIRRDWPRLKVLVLSMHNEEQYAVRTIRAGAQGYVTKTSAPNDLISAIRRVADGHMWVTENVAEQLAQVLAPAGVSGAAPHARLSEREYQIFLLIAQGWRLSRIAEELHLSPKTVSAHKANILRKLGLNNVVDLAYYAVREGLVEEPNTLLRAQSKG